MCLILRASSTSPTGWGLPSLHAALRVHPLTVGIDPKTRLRIAATGAVVYFTEGICFPLSQVSPLVLEASSQWDEGNRAVSGSSHAGYGTIRTAPRHAVRARSERPPYTTSRLAKTYFVTLPKNGARNYMKPISENPLRWARNLLTLAVVSTACDGHNATIGDMQNTVDEYALHAIDSVVLAETEEVYLGQPVGLAIAESGDIYVADAFNSQVLRYGSDGTLLAVVGAPGPGPGELEFVYTTFIAGPSIVVVEGRNRVFEFFDRISGAYERQLAVSGLPGVTIPSQRQDTLWLGLRNSLANTAMARWIAGDTGVEYFGSLPTE